MDLEIISPSLSCQIISPIPFMLEIFKLIWLYHPLKVIQSLWQSWKSDLLPGSFTVWMIEKHITCPPIYPQKLSF